MGALKDWTDDRYGPGKFTTTSQKVVAMDPYNIDNGRAWAIAAGDEGPQWFTNFVLGAGGYGKVKLGNADPYSMIKGYTRSNVADGFTAVIDGYKSGSKSGGVVSGILGALGIGGSGGGLFGAAGGALMAGIGGAWQGYETMRNEEKDRAVTKQRYADLRKTEGRAPLGFNVFEDASPKDYLAGIPQKEQGVGNYYNPTTRPYQMQQASSPNQGMLSQQNQSMGQPAGMGLLGSGNQRRIG